MPIPLPLDGTDQQLAGQDGGALVRRSVLPGGIRVLTEHDAVLRSATFGAWVGVGSRDEDPDRLGSTHFLEHLLFKGTATRSARDIAEAFDRVGGESNAFTAKEQTCYHGRVRSADLPGALDVVLDMVTSSTLEERAFETERGVILEELAMAQDDPLDLGHDTFVSLVLGDTPVGRPVGGTPESIRAVSRDAVAAHYAAAYGPETLVVTAAGDIDHDALCAAVHDGLARAGWNLTAGAVPAPRRHGPASGTAGRGGTTGSAASVPGRSGGDPATRRIHRDLEQSHIFLGTSGLPVRDERRYTLSVLNAALGGGMSSRLFQSVREERGLAYSVYSFGGSWSDTGVVGMYAGCRPEAEEEVVGLLGDELAAIARDSLGADELDRVRGQLAGGLVLGLEDTPSRMSRLGRAELVEGEYASVDEILRRLQEVERDDVAALAAELASRPRSLLVVGR